MGAPRLFGALLAVSLVTVSLLAPGCSGDDTTAPAPQELANNTIGASGGEISSSGVKLTIPAGALDHNVTITVATSSAPTPTGYVALSPIFVFGPEGTTFAKPVTVTMAFTDDGKPATAFWSTAGGTAYEDIGGTAAGGQMTAQVTHFSQGFVGRQGQEDGGTDSSVGKDSSPVDSTTGDETPSVDSAVVDTGAVDSSGGSDSSSGVDSSGGGDASDASSPSDSSTADSSTPDGGVDSGGMFCQAGLTACGTNCVDTKNSPTNCGGCGISCGLNQLCSNGFCPNCPTLGQQCAGSCCQGVVCVNALCQYAAN
jgi:hypothetical protein